MTNRQIQDLLDYLGYTVSNDGVIGAQTKNAIKDFQSRQVGLAVDGVAGKQTQSALITAVKTGWSKPIEAQNNTTANTQSSQAKAETVTANDWSDLKYIKRNEFRCTCNGKYCNGFPVEPSLETAKILEQIRIHFGRPVTITSGIRCEKRNAEVGGASGSYHCRGLASDIQVSGVPADKVADYAETLLPNSGGIGRYARFTHIDTRSTKSRWKG